MLSSLFVFSVFEVVTCLSKITQVTVFDESTGEVLADKWIYGARLKGGWCMLYQQKGLDLIAKAPNASVLKVFMYLACGQTYQGGMKTTKRAVEQNLGLGHKAVALAFKWLKDNFIVHEWRVDGCSEFMLSPVYVCVGKFEDRMKLWNQRWESYQPMYSSNQYHRKKRADSASNSSAAK